MAKEQELQFPINTSLLTEAQKIKQERSLVRERLEKIEAKRDEVSSGVYQKVKQDYTAKLSEVSNALLEKKTDIDRELSSLYETRSKVGENLQQNKEVLEELKFRHDLNEFDEKEFATRSAEISDKIGKFEKVLSAINSNIERYEAIFADEEGIADMTEPSVKQKPDMSVEAPPSALLDDSEYHVEDDAVEKDYFAPEGATEKSIDVTKKTAAPATGVAKAIVIEGEFAGQEYILKKENPIGRANSNTIILKDAKVSRQHAVIRQTGNEFSIIDLNSSNGITVNHERVKEHVLSDGDQFQVGDHVFQFKIFP